MKFWGVSEDISTESQYKVQLSSRWPNNLVLKTLYMLFIKENVFNCTGPACVGAIVRNARMKLEVMGLNTTDRTRAYYV